MQFKQQRFAPAKLREFRKAASLTQEQLAHAVGRSVYTIRDYEYADRRSDANRNRSYKPSVGTLTAIAAALGRRVEDFFVEVRAEVE